MENWEWVEDIEQSAFTFKLRLNVKVDSREKLLLSPETEQKHSIEGGGPVGGGE